MEQHLDERRILNSVRLEKDVDGFHPLNMGNLAMRGREPLFLPCTPKGCIELLIRSGIEISGKRAVVIGTSNIVGLPTSLLLQVHIHFYIQNHFWHFVCSRIILVLKYSLFWFSAEAPCHCQYCSCIY